MASVSLNSDAEADRPPGPSGIVLGTALALFGAGALSRVAVLVGGEQRLFSQFPSEDGYLMLTVARNLALGLGVTTAAGSIPTNGIQPLVTLLWSGAFALTEGDRLAGVRLVLALETLFASAVPILLFLVGRRVLGARPWAASASLLAAAVWYASPLALRISMNCQESGLYALATLAVVALALDLETRRTPARVAALGLLLGATFWIRNDAVFLAGAVVGLHWLRGLLDPVRSAQDARRRVGEGFAMGALALAVASPWLAYNQIFFGSIVPISGHAEQLGSTLGGNLLVLPAVLAGYLLGVVWIPARVELQPIAALAGAPLVLAAAAALGRALPRATRRERDAVILVGLLAAALCTYYGAFFGVPFFLKRYLFPVFPFTLLAVCVGVCVLGMRLRRSRVGVLPAAVGAVALVGWVVASLMGFHSQGTEHSHTPTVDWVRENVPESDWVGAIQSGTLGFFHDRTINLDGKVNPDALRAAQRGQIGRYVVDSEIRWLVDQAILLRLAKRPLITANFEIVVNEPSERLVALRRRERLR